MWSSATHHQAMNGRSEQFGEERVGKCCGATPDAAGGVVAALLDAAQPTRRTPQSDDMTVIAVRRTA